MATTQTLQTINDMQVNAQSGLPVIPNNGNPAGAYNMPQPAAGVAQAPPAVNRFPWMQQSPFMATLSEQLKANGARLQQEYMATNAAPIIPSMGEEAIAPVAPMQTQPLSQALPSMAMPQGATQAVLPIQGTRPITTTGFAGQSHAPPVLPQFNDIRTNPAQEIR